MCKRWRDIPKPTIAQVHGGCIAGGLMLAWVCDLIIASEAATFALPEPRVGLAALAGGLHVNLRKPEQARKQRTLQVHTLNALERCTPVLAKQHAAL